jgi:predicted PhzF superfamily epimerase YddE/YHI9
MPERSYEFVQLDVFTQTALTGNALAVFTDARGLNDDEMQALREQQLVALRVGWSNTGSQIVMNKQ